MASERTNIKQEGLFRNRVARAIFSSPEFQNISDRGLLEKLTDQVIGRLERSRPLPGMEGFLPEGQSPRGAFFSPAAIRAVAREVLADWKEDEVTQTHVLPEQGDQPELEEVAAEEKVIPEVTSNALTVLERRYLKKDDTGKVIEKPEEMFRRVAHHIAAADLNYDPKADVKSREEEFYRAMVSFEFLPNSPTLMNAGRELGQLSACFVLPVEDSMDSIFNAVKYTALIHKSGGGTGFSFSRLRPEGDLVGSTGRVASGPVSFMRAFDMATEVIKQGGMRRGANMGILNVDHPDIERFIRAKEDTTQFNNFNLSVAVTEKFMKAVEEDRDYDLVNPRTGEVVGKLNAREVFQKMVAKAWETGDPGIVFLDRINDDNPTPKLGPIESTNPCGEQPLLPFESCNLGSINLSLMVSEREGKARIDYDKLAKTVRTAVRFLDNVIDVNNFPLEEIRERTLATRKIGLGVMGFADMLIKLGIAYDSEEALKTAEEVMAFIQEKASDASVELARERGVFPAFEGSVYDVPGGLRVRNATRTTIAPTGTLSIIAGCSSGIEPLFALSYVRNVLDDDRLVEVNPIFARMAQERGFYSEELMKTLAVRGGLRDMEEIPQELRRLFVTAHDITPEWHVRMQAAFQKSTNNAVSKTVNFPREATAEDVARVFLLAYKEGCKGVTIYRDRSRDKQVLSRGEGVKAEKAEGVRLTPRMRPQATTGRTERVATGCGNLYITVNSDEQGICEVFSSLGKAGGCASGQLEAICRLISLALRSGVDLNSVVKHLKGIRCPSIAWDSGHAVLSCADAIGRVLERYQEGAAGEGNPMATAKVRNLAGQCPECSSLLIYQEGCLVCRACGYTKCG